MVYSKKAREWEPKQAKRYDSVINGRRDSSIREDLNHERYQKAPAKKKKLPYAIMWTSCALHHCFRDVYGGRQCNVP